MTSSALSPKIPPMRLHAYAASFGDDLARDLLSSNASEGGCLLDPWAGSGTGLIQARMLGVNCIGIDIDPVACLICNVSLFSFGVDELDELLVHVTRQVNAIEAELSPLCYGEDSWPAAAHYSINGFEGVIPNIDALEFWFAPLQRAILSALVALANSFTDSRYQELVRVAISSSIIRKWPNTISQAMDIDHSRPHRVLRDDLTVSSQIGIFRKVINQVVKRLKSINSQPSNHNFDWKVIEGDATIVLRDLPLNSVDYILSSPPYFNAIDYPRAHKFSQWWLWPNRESLNKNHYLGLSNGGKDTAWVKECIELVPEIANRELSLPNMPGPMHRALCKYIVELNSVVYELSRVLRQGGKATLVIGNNVIRGHVIPIADVLGQLLAQNGFANVKLEPRAIKIDRRRYPYGLTGFKGLMESEYLVEGEKA